MKNSETNRFLIRAEVFLNKSNLYAIKPCINAECRKYNLKGSKGTANK